MQNQWPVLGEMGFNPDFNTDLTNPAAGLQGERNYRQMPPAVVYMHRCLTVSKLNRNVQAMSLAALCRF
jgi:hypothetical protein